MTISFPSNTSTIISDIRTAIGRTVDFYIPVTTPCSGCTIDPNTNTSTNSFCTICSGEGYVKTYVVSGILAHVTYAPIDKRAVLTGGDIFEGDCRVQVEYTVANLDIISNFEYCSVDGNEFTLKKKTPRGVPSLNRVLVDLVERT